MATAYLFPGQGAQTVGMGADLVSASPAAAELFERAEAVSGLPLRKLCFEGPADELARTDISQPAIFTMSMAALAALQERMGDRTPAPRFFAGLSLGEYTALCSAGAISFDDAVSLVTRRGRYMQDAAEATEGGMVSLVGADEKVAQAVCAAVAGEGLLVPANFNCPGQIVVSGQIAACRRAVDVAAACGASGAVPLQVAGAFHSPLMAPAAERLDGALASVDFQEPTSPVLSNVTARPHEPQGESIRRRLLEQLTSPVRWQQCCEHLLAAGADELYEVGPNRVLAGLMRKIDRKARVTSLNSADAVAKLADAGN